MAASQKGSLTLAMARTRRKRSSRKSASSGAPWWLVWALLIGALLYVAWVNDLHRYIGSALDPTSEAAFESWLDQDEGRAQEYAAFQAFLSDQGVDDVIPAWQLARVDREYAERCNLDIWRLPPENLWPNIVPALELVRAHVKPAMGEVEVQSSYRSPELNVCAGGAARSRHISFEALDLLLVERRSDLDALYHELCAMQEEAGPDSRMGLGAYYDPSDPFYNREGRFHIDAAGYRSWGRSYTRATSICPRG